MKKYLLGMAKSNLDLKGGKARSLELDYLRLAYAVSNLRLKGLEAKGYLSVTTNAVAKRIEKWQSKYLAKDYIEIIVGNGLSGKDFKNLHAEKKRNAKGIYGKGRKDSNRIQRH